MRGVGKVPVIAGFVNASNEPILQPYMVIERGGVKLGIFALDGSDFEKLVLPRTAPRAPLSPMASRSRPRSSRSLREVEKVDAVIEIGHRSYEDDVKLAQTSPAST